MESINKPELVKEHNLQLLRETLFQVRQATRQQLSVLTGISTVTLGSLLQELMQQNTVYEAEAEQPKTGRPAHIYCFNGNVRYALLLYARPTGRDSRLAAAVVNLYGETVWEREYPLLPMDREATRRFLEPLLHLRQPLGAVCVGLPGVGFHEYIHREPQLHFLSLDVLEELGAEQGIPVLVENDINLAALGYAAESRVPPEECLLYLYLMKGRYSGAGIYLDGHLHLGLGRFAGELPIPAYGIDWPRADTESPEAVCEILRRLLLPAVSLLAPHRVAVASDYVGEEHLSILREQLGAVVGPPYCPALCLAEHFEDDYAAGIKRMALEQIAI